ncbi:hypothetical protein EDD86DRAFT_209495 [Gorgonomyces haynaldii]|nr:hypothetical protein EDD86DRAFT_209495 [Gorgonomyces haynaldii]
MSKVGSRVIFIGNIPYDVSETQIVDIFSEVGKVLNFRLVFDRDTGKPKGFGFLTYPDHETAASAVRNLNNYEVNGRTLRVDFAENDKENEVKVEKDPTQVVAQMQPHQLVEMLSQLKQMAHTNVDQTRTFLLSQPQVTFAVFQALLTMNMVDQYTVQRILGQHTQQPYQAPGFQQFPGQDLQEQQQQILLQLINLPEDQIRSLPLDQQQQIMQLKQQVMGRS